MINVDNLSQFAEKLDIPKYILTRYVFSADYFYKAFRVRKKSGAGYRTICAPSPELKGLQRWILTNILRKQEISEASMAFRPTCSTLKNAKQPSGRNFVFSADIKDFFPSITVERVFGLFRQLGYSKEMTFALARLTTYKGKLPQGAPSSPEIGNLICRSLDNRLLKFCELREWSFTRYCDDLTISGNSNLSEAAIQKIHKIVTTEGFHLNKAKTHLTRKNSRQLVTGLVVNHHPSIPRNTRKRLRAILHQAFLNPKDFVHRYNELKGYEAYIHMVNPDDKLLESSCKALQKLAEYQE